MRCLLKNATIVDSSGERVTVHILTDDKKILKISRETLDIPAMEYDLNGYTVMPGFINTHVHLMDSFDENPHRKEGFQSLIRVAPNYLLNNC